MNAVQLGARDRRRVDLTDALRTHGAVRHVHDRAGRRRRPGPHARDRPLRPQRRQPPGLAGRRAAATRRPAPPCATSTSTAGTTTWPSAPPGSRPGRRSPTAPPSPRRSPGPRGPRRGAGRGRRVRRAPRRGAGAAGGARRPAARSPRSTATSTATRSPAAPRSTRSPGASCSPPAPRASAGSSPRWRSGGRPTSRPCWAHPTSGGGRGRRPRAPGGAAPPAEPDAGRRFTTVDRVDGQAFDT